MKQPFFYIANWKMNSSFEQSLTFCMHNQPALLQLSAYPDTTLVIAPSFPALHAIAQLFENSALHVAAQNCSEHTYGAYTGQVDAASLAQVGCTYCIVGHSEARAYLYETNEQIGNKVNRLLEQNITPIICIGETQADYEQGKTYTHLEQQLLPISKALTGKMPVGRANIKHTSTTHTNTPHSNYACLIAYEPIWAIGTGITPPTDYLTKIFAWLQDYCTQHMPNINIALLYGGSVDATNATELKKIDGINGFLIGGASLDFQKLQKIIVCTY